MDDVKCSCRKLVLGPEVYIYGDWSFVDHSLLSVKFHVCEMRLELGCIWALFEEVLLCLKFGRDMFLD